ncbi:M23 family metallopeptidase [Pseudooceanicola nanhaiensis]|uniref:M23 family metallopeptidase n=1 Tax=Pseudooceanicola nanhaiensis TaxID=375761 RepID=UPI001CD2889E|nr:M23 family metallopeptidase [Pseudooceanicola nanhaiensis]MCA0920580.1 M23 family metallopeptidase [Pseudooceanicola nanhaiensis]
MRLDRALAALPLFGFLSAAGPSAAEPSLTLYADCTLGETCYFQQYVDHDPGPEAEDFTCGALSYDGHKGTDLAVPSLAAMMAGVDVIAAAPGRVIGTRDGVEDRIMPPEGDDRPACGNGVAIDHGEGWVTQYCHMRRGSIRVRTGDVLERGALLGQVGLSGRTQFPHVHMSVRRGDEVIDPFAVGGGCGTPGRSLWAETPAYLPTGLIALGFSDGLPSFDDIKSGAASEVQPGRDAGALVLWAYAYGSKPGDGLRFHIEGPEGALLDNDVALEKQQILYYQAAGKRLKAPLPAGTYRGEVTLTREGLAPVTRTITMTVAQ